MLLCTHHRNAHSHPQSHHRLFQATCPSYSHNSSTQLQQFLLVIIVYYQFVQGRGRLREFGANADCVVRKYILYLRQSLNRKARITSRIYQVIMFRARVGRSDRVACEMGLCGDIHLRAGRHVDGCWKRNCPWLPQIWYVWKRHLG